MNEPSVHLIEPSEALLEQGVSGLRGEEPVLTGKSEDRILGFTVLPMLLIFAAMAGMVWALGPFADLPLVDAYGALGFGRRLGLLASILLLLGAAVFGILGLGRRIRMRRRRAMEVLARRSASVVDPLAPDAEYVELVSCHLASRPEALDVGFLRLDLERHVLLYEGGRERWAIRATDLTKVQVEEVETTIPNQVEGTARTMIWHRLRLVIENPALGQLERGLQVFDGSWSPKAGRKEQERMRERLLNL